MADQGGTTGTPAPEDEEERRRRRRPIAWWWWAAGAGVIVLVVLAVLLSGGGDDGDGDSLPASDDDGSSAPASTTATSAATEAASESSDDGEAVAESAPSIEGVWEFIVDVTETSGVCAGEEDEDPDIGNVTIRKRDGDDYAVTGLGTNPDDEWDGHWDGDSFVFNGQREEDGGITTARFTIAFDEEGALGGDEDWSWSSTSEGTCPEGKSTVQAYFYSPLP